MCTRPTRCGHTEWVGALQTVAVMSWHKFGDLGSAVRSCRLVSLPGLFIPSSLLP